MDSRDERRGDVRRINDRAERRIPVAVDVRGRVAPDDPRLRRSGREHAVDGNRERRFARREHDRRVHGTRQHGDVERRHDHRGFGVRGQRERIRREDEAAVVRLRTHDERVGPAVANDEGRRQAGAGRRDERGDRGGLGHEEESRLQHVAHCHAKRRRPGAHGAAGRLGPHLEDVVAGRARERRGASVDDPFAAVRLEGRRPANMEFQARRPAARARPGAERVPGDDPRRIRRRIRRVDVQLADGKRRVTRAVNGNGDDVGYDGGG